MFYHCMIPPIFFVIKQCLSFLFLLFLLFQIFLPISKIVDIIQVDNLK